MRRFASVVLSLLVSVVSLYGERPRKDISCDIQQKGNQFHVDTAVMNRPIVRATMKSGTNYWDARGYTYKFKFAKDDSQSAMTTVTGSLTTVSGIASNSTIDFYPATNSFSRPVDKWYAVVLVETGSVPVSYCRGLITINRSPEINASAALPTTIQINGGAGYTFTGTFTNWPFMLLPTNSPTAGQTLFATSRYSYYWGDSIAGDITAVTVSGGLLTITSGTGPVPIVGLSTSAVRNAVGALTNVLPAVQSTSNQVAKVGNLVRVTFNTNWISPTWIAAQGYHDAAQLTGTVANARLDADLQVLAVNNGVNLTNLTTTGDWTGTFDGQQGAWYRNGANITNAPWLTAESDTLQTVANRGATATNKLTLSGGVNMGGASLTNARVRALDMYNAGGQTNGGTIRAKSFLYSETGDITEVQIPGLRPSATNLKSMILSAMTSGETGSDGGILLTRNAEEGLAFNVAGEIIVHPKTYTGAGSKFSLRKVDGLRGWSFDSTSGNVDCWGNTQSNALFVGDGSGLTNLPASSGGVATNDLAYLEWKSICVTNLSGTGIKAALALANAGDEIYMPAGIYNCSNITITIPTSNLTLRGAGWGTVLNAPNQTNHLIQLGGFANTTIKDMQLRGNKAGVTAFDIINGASANEDFIRIEHVYISASDNDGIRGSSNDQQLGWRITGSRVENCDDDGISLAGQQNTVSDCSLSANDGYGVAVKYSRVNICYVSGGTYGIGAIGLGTTVNSCWVTAASTAGIYLNSGASAIGNYVWVCTGHGIQVNDGGQVMGNYVYANGNTYNDIQVKSGATVVGNYCTSLANLSERGIHIITGGTLPNLVANNISLGHDTAGIQEDASSVTNLIYGNNCLRETKPYALANTPSGPQSFKYFDLGGPVTQNVFNITKFGFRPSAVKYYKIWGGSFASTVTLDVVSFATNSMTLTTNGSFVLPATGMSSTTWTAQTNAANRTSGYKLRQRGATCTNFWATIQYFGE